MWYNFAITVEVLIGVVLILVVLMQSSKGGGLAGNLGGASLGTVFGVRRMSDTLTKTTQVLAGILFVLALVINLWLLPRAEQKESIVQPSAPTSTLPPVQQTPDQGSK